jgi:hypothetical protein
MGIGFLELVDVTSWGKDLSPSAPGEEEFDV